jgi:hypothetical protein
MRRFGWVQIAGLLVACGLIAGLAVLAFGRGASPPRPVPPRASASARATATPDPRVAEVEAAARRYIEAVEQSARTGDPSEVDQLVVPGSQAEGNAAITADFSRENHYNFIATRIDVDPASTHVTVLSTSASAIVQYVLFGHDADWPSLRPRETDHSTKPVTLHLEFELRADKWLIAQSS